jgi:hypothetical protein
MIIASSTRAVARYTYITLRVLNCSRRAIFIANSFINKIRILANAA